MANSLVNRRFKSDVVIQGNPAKVLIIGGGISGTEAAKMAIGLGANVTILDLNQEKFIL